MSRPSGIKRGKVTSAEVLGGRTILSVDLLSGEHRTGVELMMALGVSAIPSPGADVLVQEVGGDRGHLVATVCDDPTLRVQGLAPGEMGMRDALGQQVIFGADGVVVTGALKVTIVSAGEIVMDGPVIRLGAGASKQVKLADDTAASKVFAE